MSKSYKNRGKRVENEFTWMVEQSKGIDKHLKKIHNGLRNNTLEELIIQSDQTMNKRYQQRYNITNGDIRFQYGWDLQASLINVDKNLHNGRIRHNILMRMYDEQYNKLPWIKRVFTKRIKSDYYEVTTHKVKL
jgi:hypothetical protein